MVYLVDVMDSSPFESSNVDDLLTHADSSVTGMKFLPFSDVAAAAQAAGAKDMSGFGLEIQVGLGCVVMGGGRDSLEKVKYMTRLKKLSYGVIMGRRMRFRLVFLS